MDDWRTKFVEGMTRDLQRHYPDAPADVLVAGVRSIVDAVWEQSRAVQRKEIGRIKALLAKEEAKHPPDPVSIQGFRDWIRVLEAPDK